MKSTLHGITRFIRIDYKKIIPSYLLPSPKSRDDIPQLLLGLQHIYIHKNTFNQVIDILEKSISPDKDHGNGRPGMDLWKILVLQTSTIKHNRKAKTT